MKFIKTDGGRGDAFPNLTTKKELQAGDCVIRAIAIGTQLPYKKVWDELFSIAKETGCFPNSELTYIKYLSNLGWNELKFGKKLVRITYSEVVELSRNRFIICHTAGHLVAMRDGDIYDTYNSSKNSMDNYERVFRVYYKD